MFKTIIAAALAAIALFATASAEAQNRVAGLNASNATLCDRRTGQAPAQGTPREFLAYCRPHQQGPGNAPQQQSGPNNPPVVQQQQMGAPAPVRPLSPSEMDNLKQVLRGEMQQQQRPVVYPAAPRSPASSSAATQQQQQEVRIVIQAPTTATPVVTSQPVSPAPSASQASPAHEQGIVIDKM